MGAALLYIFSQSLVYSISKYSEPLFTFLQLSGIYLAMEGKMKTKYLLPASFIWSFATVVRSTGTLTVIIPVYFSLHKLGRNLFKIDE